MAQIRMLLMRSTGSIDDLFCAPFHQKEIVL